jgi:7,8-dihydropterin-6-yl-methyl-4-(beta-D-ribofuranosyl)aminobenzene 5'-phosphate synthase
MRITTLIENHGAREDEGLQAEFGLSLHVELGETRILFDTGATGAFAGNASRLGTDLSAVDLVVLSHHHFDHGGGLAAFLERNSRAPIYLKRPVDGAQYARVFGLFSRYVGIDQGLLESHEERFVFVDRFAEVAPGWFIVPDVLRLHPRPKGNRFLYLRTRRGWERDDFDHELILVARDADGIVIFTGCSHGGILNMIRTVADRFPGAPIKAVIGGFHLLGAPPFRAMGLGKKQIAELGRKLLAYPGTAYHTGHCTGDRAFRALKRIMGERLNAIHTGSVTSL